MRQENILIIGGVACGPKAASRINRLNADAKITLIEKSDWFSYFASGIPDYIGATVKDLSDLQMTTWEATRTPEFMKNVKGFDTMMGWEATAIDRGNKKVAIKSLENGEEQVLTYDKLILATGAKNKLPEIKNIEAEGVMTIKTPQDGMNLQNAFKTGVASVVILGAGPQGIEMAEACANWGVEVTLVEKEDYILPTMLDKDMALIFQDYLEEEDFDVRVGVETSEVLLDEEGNVRGIATNQGEIECDLVLVTAGFEPEIDLAKEAGLECDRGILVNEYLQTSDENIYAGGDCIEVLHRISDKNTLAAMGSTANKHGRIIGTNVCEGNIHTFPGVIDSKVTKVFDWNAGSTGLSEKEAIAEGFDVVTAIVPGPDKAHFMPGGKLILVKTIADRKSARILGIQIVGPGDLDKRLETMAGALSANPKLTAYDMATLDIAYAPGFSAAVDTIIASGNVIQNVIEGRANSYTYPEALDRVNNDDALYIDVRVDEEVQAYTFPAENMLHIPLEELRDRADEVPKDKDVIVFCLLSTRGFAAQRILEQAGVKNVHFVQAGVQFWPFDEDVKSF